jgi:hypothetical protein
LTTASWSIFITDHKNFKIKTNENHQLIHLSKERGYVVKTAVYTFCIVLKPHKKYYTMTFNLLKQEDKFGGCDVIEFDVLHNK